MHLNILTTYTGAKEIPFSLSLTAVKFNETTAVSMGRWRMGRQRIFCRHLRYLSIARNGPSARVSDVTTLGVSELSTAADDRLDTENQPGTP